MHSNIMHYRIIHYVLCLPAHWMVNEPVDLSLSCMCLVLHYVHYTLCIIALYIMHYRIIHYALSHYAFEQHQKASNAQLQCSHLLSLSGPLAPLPCVVVCVDSQI
jgi:hypothetical protein